MYRYTYLRRHTAYILDSYDFYPATVRHIEGTDIYETEKEGHYLVVLDNEQNRIEVHRLFDRPSVTTIDEKTPLFKLIELPSKLIDTVVVVMGQWCL